MSLPINAVQVWDYGNPGYYLATDFKDMIFVKKEDVPLKELWRYKTFYLKGTPVYMPGHINAVTLWLAVDERNFEDNDTLNDDEDDTLWTVEKNEAGAWGVRIGTGPWMRWESVHDLRWYWPNKALLPTRLQAQAIQINTPPKLIHHSEEFEVHITHLPNLNDPDYEVVRDKRIEEEKQKKLSTVRKRKEWPLCCGDPLEPSTDFTLHGYNAGYLTITLECKHKHLTY